MSIITDIREIITEGLFSLLMNLRQQSGNRPIPDGYLGHAGDPVSISENVRPLTTFERARLQTFPEDFKFKGAKTNLEQMIGNAVPVELAKYVR
ncbi:DNA cytosine methyltransferase [Escherichia coli]